MGDVWVEALDVELDALEGSPTSSEVMSVTDVYEASTGVAVAVRRAMEGGGGGGSQTATSTLTINRAGGFIAQHAFDLGAGPHPAQVSFTCTALTADGETFGSAAGNIFVELVAGVGAMATSDDGIAYSSITSSLTPSGFKHCAVLDRLIAVNDNCVYLGVCSRYLLVYTAIWTIDDFDVYAGANNPVAALSVAATYL